jgi:UDP-glucose 4-epimerase
MLNENMGLKIQPEYVENPIKNYVKDTQADPTKTSHVLEFTARYSLNDGIKNLVEYYSLPQLKRS